MPDPAPQSRAAKPPRPQPTGPSASPASDPLDPARLIVLVVGAHLRAEHADRPTVEVLRQAAAGWLDRAFGPGGAVAHPCLPIVCTDVWYLNQPSLQARPTISVGNPDINALSAFLTDKLPTIFSIDGRLAVQMDLDLADLAACCWGVDAPSTAQAVEAFVRRYLDRFMRGAAAPWLGGAGPTG